MKSLIFCGLLLLSIPVFGQRLTKADYLSDLDYLKDTLPKRHINLFAKISPAAFDRAVDSIKSGIGPADEDNFIVALYRLMVAIGDEHTHIEPVFTRTLPIQFEEFSEGFFVAGKDSALVGIGGHDIKEVIRRFKTIIRSENPSFFSSRLLTMLNNPSVLKGLQLTDSASFAIYQLRGADGKTVDRLVRAVPVVKKEENARSYTYSYDQRSGTLYFDYLECKEDQASPFAAFNQELFSVIRDKHPKRLVVDLRNNSGGNSGILTPFLDSLKTSNVNASGKLFVLIGKQTFSSAIMNAVDLKRNTHAILVGEPTSGSINHYGEVRGFHLPHSRMIIGYSTRYWENWPGHDGPLRPDVVIGYSEKNSIRGIDEALRYVNTH